MTVNHRWVYIRLWSFFEQRPASGLVFGHFRFLCQVDLHTPVCEVPQTISNMYTVVQPIPTCPQSNSTIACQPYRSKATDLIAGVESQRHSNATTQRVWAVNRCDNHITWWNARAITHSYLHIHFIPTYCTYATVGFIVQSGYNPLNGCSTTDSLDVITHFSYNFCRCYVAAVTQPLKPWVHI